MSGVLTRILQDHAEVWDDTALHGWSCACGWTGQDGFRATEAEYRAHVAAKIEAVLGWKAADV